MSGFNPSPVSFPKRGGAIAFDCASRTIKITRKPCNRRHSIPDDRPSPLRGGDVGGVFHSAGIATPLPPAPDGSDGFSFKSHASFADGFPSGDGVFAGRRLGAAVDEP